MELLLWKYCICMHIYIYICMYVFMVATALMGKLSQTTGFRGMRFSTFSKKPLYPKSYALTDRGYCPQYGELCLHPWDGMGFRFLGTVTLICSIIFIYLSVCLFVCPSTDLSDCVIYRSINQTIYLVIYQSSDYLLI